MSRKTDRKNSCHNAEFFGGGKKKAFNSYDEARDWLFDHKKKLYETYYCKFCKKWHNGKPSKKMIRDRCKAEFEPFYIEYGERVINHLIRQSNQNLMLNEIKKLEKK